MPTLAQRKKVQKALDKKTAELNKQSKPKEEPKVKKSLQLKDGRSWKEKDKWAPGESYGNMHKRASKLNPKNPSFKVAATRLD